MAITPKQTATVGTLTIEAGTWTNTAGAAVQTKVIGGHVFLAQFSVASSTVRELVPWSQAVSGAKTTLTVYPQTTQTAGKYIIVYAAI